MWLHPQTALLSTMTGHRSLEGRRLGKREQENGHFEYFMVIQKSSRGKSENIGKHVEVRGEWMIILHVLLSI